MLSLALIDRGWFGDLSSRRKLRRLAPSCNAAECGGYILCLTTSFHIVGCNISTRLAESTPKGQNYVVCWHTQAGGPERGSIKTPRRHPTTCQRLFGITLCFLCWSNAKKYSKPESVHKLCFGKTNNSYSMCEFPTSNFGSKKFNYM